jgi:mono/diheme cytochrome c family protein
MKSKLISTVGLLAAGIFAGVVISGFRAANEKDPWPVPENYKKMANPVAANAASIAEGKALWSTHCKSCHGAKGLGDGSKAAQLKTEPGDFSKTDFQSQTDGSLFYKTTEGRDDMPSFKKKIPDADERWSIINFIRTLKK